MQRQIIAAAFQIVRLLDCFFEFISVRQLVPFTGHGRARMHIKKEFHKISMLLRVVEGGELMFRIMCESDHELLDHSGINGLM